MNNSMPALLRRLRGYLMDSSYLVWVLLGFAMSYLLFFIRPVFLNSAHMMQIFTYLPRQETTGGDLVQMIGYSKSLFGAGTAYVINFYPPLASVLFAPLAIVGSTAAYAITTFITLGCYLFMTMLIPLWTSRERKISPLLMLIFISGLFSYGLQFEIERGQWNVIAGFLSLAAIWIFHYSKFRYLAYILFSLSIQLKIFPAIFLVMFIRDWRDWKNNVKRLLGLAAANLALLFILGPGVFFNYLKVIRAQMVDPAGSLWIGNHSIHSFVEGLIGKLRAHHLEAGGYASLMQLALLALIAACILLIMFKAYQQRRTHLDTRLLLACTIGALLIPSISHDYKLSLLAAPVAMFFLHRPFSVNDDNRLRPVFFVLTFIFSLAYSSTLFSYTNKITVAPGISYPDLATSSLLGSNLPPLIVMLFVVTAFSLLDGKGSDK